MSYTGNWRPSLDGGEELRGLDNDRGYVTTYGDRWQCSVIFTRGGGITWTEATKPAAKRKVRKELNEAGRRAMAAVDSRPATAPKTRRRHSRDGAIRCELCSPLRCSRAPR